MVFFIILMVFSLAILIGFEQTTYTFEEPRFQSFSTEQICLQLSTGRIDQTLSFRVRWNSITAVEGLPGVGGDYVPQSTVYSLAPGMVTTCINVFIQRDNAFERREEFGGQIVSVQLPDGSIVPTAPGISIIPDTTRVFIDNIDGKKNYC